MVDFIFCASTNLFRVYLIYRFIHLFFEKRGEDWRKELAAYGAFFLINTASYLTFHLVWVNIFCNLAGIGLILLLYTRSVRMNLFVTCLICTISMACDTISTLLFVDYKDGTGFDQKYAVITVLFILICELLAERIVNDGNNTGNIENMSLILVPFSSILLICLLIYTGSCTEIGFVIVSTGLLLINFFILSFYHILSDTFIQKYENEALRQKLQSYSNQIDVVLQSEEKSKALRHDMKHHMNELKLMAIRSENEQIQNYIDDMQEFIANPNEMVSSGNWEIDSVLNYMLCQAKKELLTVNVNVLLPEAVRHSFDINVILGNLLENAIEGAKGTKEKKLDVNVRLKQEVLRIEIANSFDGRVEKKQQRILTTKKEKEIHGIGLCNVRKIVEKYNGVMEVDTKQNTFCVRLILYLLQGENSSS